MKGRINWQQKQFYSPWTRHHGTPQLPATGRNFPFQSTWKNLKKKKYYFFGNWLQRWKKKRKFYFCFSCFVKIMRKMFLFFRKKHIKHNDVTEVWITKAQREFSNCLSENQNCFKKVSLTLFLRISLVFSDIHART